MAVFLVCSASAISNTRSVGNDEMYSDSEAWKRFEWVITALRSEGLRSVVLARVLVLAEGGAEGGVALVGLM